MDATTPRFPALPPPWRGPSGNFEQALRIPKPPMVEDRPPDVATSLHRLRRAYARYGWAFLHTGGDWIALRGQNETLIRQSPIDLREAIESAPRAPGRQHSQQGPIRQEGTV